MAGHDGHSHLPIKFRGVQKPPPCEHVIERIKMEGMAKRLPKLDSPAPCSGCGTLLLWTVGLPQGHFFCSQECQDRGPTVH